MGVEWLRIPNAGILYMKKGGDSLADRELPEMANHKYAQPGKHLCRHLLHGSPARSERGRRTGQEVHTAVLPRPAMPYPALFPLSPTHSTADHTWIPAGRQAGVRMARRRSCMR
eukprot:GGOE01005428.1.p2 GENE.GGOE01005428.1~~GGOE01005428.1.p2  ORF type:complete len:114 (+),score=5.26 GGOE01005428.1:926-1267(+)